MLALLLASAVQSQIWFTHQQHSQTTDIVTHARSTQNCECSYSVSVNKTGPSGTSRTTQQQDVTLTAGQDQALSTLRFTLSPQDKVQISVKLYQGDTLLSEAQTQIPDTVSQQN